MQSLRGWRLHLCDVTPENRPRRGLRYVEGSVGMTGLRLDDEADPAALLAGPRRPHVPARAGLVPGMA